MMRRYSFVALAAAIGLIVVTHTVHATPYASGVSISGTNVVSFLLNEPATTLTYSINGGTPIALDGSTIGSKSFNLGSPTNKFTINAGTTDATGYSIPTGGTVLAASSGMNNDANASGMNLISSDANSLNWFFSPRGVAVSNNPNAPNFGTAYVANSAPGTAAPAAGTRSVTKGLYAIHADGSDAYGYGITAANPAMQDGLTAWTDGSTNSPFRLAVGPTGDVVAADYASANANAFYLSPDLTTGHYLLTGFNGTAPSTDAGNGDGTVQPAHQYHGSVEAVDVTGSLGGGNLALYTLDEQLPLQHVTGNPTDSLDTRYSIWKYTIGGAANVDTANSDPVAGSPYGFTGQPAIQVTDPGAFGNFFSGGIIEDMQRGADGKFYFMQSRNAGNEAGVTVADASGNKIYDSLTATRALPGGTPTPPDILNTLRGMTVSPDQKWLAGVLGSSDIVAVPLVNGLPDLAHRLVVDTGPLATGRDIAFDAADNIEYVSSGQQLLRILALGGQTLTTLAYDPTQAAGSQYSFNVQQITSLAGDYNNDGKVDAQDYVLWRKSPGTYGGNPAGYIAWRSNFGAGGPGAGSSLSGSSVPEPGTLLLALTGIVAFGFGRRRQ